MPIPDFIKKYFDCNSSEQFNSPALIAEIEQMEETLGFTLPIDYKEFLKFSNGCQNEFLTFIPVQSIVEWTGIYCAEFYPWAVYIGSDGGNEMFVIDKRTKPVQFGLLPYVGDEGDFIPLGESFEIFLSRLSDGTAFERDL